MTGNHHRHPRRCDPTFQHLDLRQIQVVGRFIEQQCIRLGDPGARNQRQPLPAPAQRMQRPLMQLRRRTKFVEHDSDAPFVTVAFGRRQRAADRLRQGQAQQVLRHVLFDIADTHAARARDIARGRLHHAGEAFQQRGLAATIAGNEAVTIGVADHHREVLEQGMWRQHADIAQADHRHDCVSWLDETRENGVQSRPAEACRLARQFRPLASPATTGRRAQSGPRG